MSRKISKSMSVTEQVKIVHEMMGNMNAVDRQLMSDKLLSYLLFDADKEVETKNDLAKSGLSDEEMKLIKELAKRTEDLKNLLGDNPDLFR